LASLIDAINIKRKTLFEFEDAPYYCMDSEISTPTARGGQTLVRLKMRNLLTSAVMDKTFKAQDKFKEPDLEFVPVSYLYSDADGSYFMDQNSFDTLTLPADVVGNSLDLLVEGTLLQLQKYNGNPIALQLPMFVELEVVEAEHAVKGDTSSGSGTKMAKLETGMNLRVPMFVKQGEKIRITTETREFSGRA
jgi:elongation factor P